MISGETICFQVCVPISKKFFFLLLCDINTVIESLKVPLPENISFHSTLDSSYVYSAMSI